MATLRTFGEGLFIDAFGERYKVLKGWESMTGWYWFATELNDDGVHFGFVQGFEEEFGYFSEEELKSSPMVWEIKKIDLPYAGRRDRPQERLGNDPFKKHFRRHSKKEASQ